MSVVDRLCTEYGTFADDNGFGVRYCNRPCTITIECWVDEWAYKTSYCSEEVYTCETHCNAVMDRLEVKYGYLVANSISVLLE